MASLPPSLEGAWELLGAAGEGRLTGLLHSLETGLRGSPGAPLLHAMVLLSLGRGSEARARLDALGKDPVAQLVARRWAGGDGSAVPEEDPPNVSWAVAQIYNLLAREKLCPASAREHSLQAALQDCTSSEDRRLRQSESHLESFQPLCSEPEAHPGPRSLPRPIEGHPSGWSRGRTLLSAGSPASLASHLEISQSPTLAFQGAPRSPPGPSKLCAAPLASSGLEPAPTGHQEPGHPPPTKPAPRIPEPAPEAPENPGPAQAPTPSRPKPEDTPGASPPTLLPPRVPLSPSPWSWGATPSLEPPRFYNFVVLHAPEDEEAALRVRQRLEDLGVPDGATFCEDFEVAGRGALRCLQDALEHAAFTLPLLTPRFSCGLSLHQLNQALLCSLTRPGWGDSVVPFLPRDGCPSRLGPDAARLLAGTVWLDERSPVFERKVARTFRPQRLRARQEQWERERGQRTRALNAGVSGYLGSLQTWPGQLEQLQALWAAGLTLGTSPEPHLQPPASGIPLSPGQQPPGTPLSPGQQPPGTPLSPGQQPPGTPLSPGQQPPGTPLSPGQQPPGTPLSPGQQPLIIHHAQMVQLGLYNHMWNQGGAWGPEDRPPQAEGP
ncbi:TIR domain-containing adapter molecule 1 isoform X2 [Erinaceus europaeus]|nr:TIR domain-containing adapter molecule 1 isoform X2 [Erinaceus europaeus]